MIGSIGNNNYMTEEMLKRSGQVECQTCAQRKYVDGSNEMVSYKSPTSISPERSVAAVKSHEQEHVTNAYTDAAKKNGEVISASVQIMMKICPECGKAYASGGLTTTQIKYDKANPYNDNKSKMVDTLIGANADYKV